MIWQLTFSLFYALIVTIAFAAYFYEGLDVKRSGIGNLSKRALNIACSFVLLGLGSAAAETFEVKVNHRIYLWTLLFCAGAYLVGILWGVVEKKFLKA